MLIVAPLIKALKILEQRGVPVCVCVCVCVCVFTSIHCEGFIYLGLEIQGTGQQCCVEDISFLCQVSLSLLHHEASSLSD